MWTPCLVYSTIFLCAAILLLRVFQLVHLEFIKWNLLECTVVQSKDKVCWMLFKQLFYSLCSLLVVLAAEKLITTSHFNFPVSIHRSDVYTRVSEIELNFIQGNMRNFSNKTAIEWYFRYFAVVVLISIMGYVMRKVDTLAWILEFIDELELTLNFWCWHVMN